MSSNFDQGILRGKEDITSQVFMLLAACLAGTASYALFQYAGGPIKWQAALLIGSAVAFVLAYLFKSVLAVGAATVTVVVWWITQDLYWGGPSGVKNIALASGLLMMGMIFYVLGKHHRSRIRPFSPIYLVASAAPVFLGAVAIAALSITFLYSTRRGLSFIQLVTKEGASALQSWQIALVLSLLAGAVVVAALLGVVKKAITRWELALILGATLVCMVFSMLPGRIYVYYPRQSSMAITSAGMAYAVAANLLLFGELFVMLAIGYLKKKPWVINTGIVLLVVLVALKYFDWFFELISRGVFLIGAGLVFLTVGLLLHHGRRFMLASIKEGGA